MNNCVIQCFIFTECMIYSWWNLSKGIGVQKKPSDEKLTIISHSGLNKTQTTWPVCSTKIVLFASLMELGARYND